MDEDTYQEIRFYIQQAFVEESGKGSISTKARINQMDGIRLYRLDQDRQIVLDEDIPLVPEGTEVQILSSLDQEGNLTGWGQYLTVDTVWVACEVPVGDQNYSGWLIPVEDLSFDSRLMLPAMWTAG